VKLAEETPHGNKSLSQDEVTRGCFRLKGLKKAGGEWVLVCLVHNIKKIYAKLMAKGGELGLTRKLEMGYNPHLKRSRMLF